MSAETLTVMSLASVAINVLLLAGALALLWHHLALKSRTRKALREARDDLTAVVSAALGVGERVEALEEKVRRQTERIEQRDLSEPLQQSYRQAMQLIDSGADIPTLVERCGVTRGEAELLENLYRAESAKRMTVR
jgi:hypothetical protein